jgi:chromosome segregation ATPase
VAPATVPGKGGRPRKRLSDTDRVRAYRARQRGEPEPATAADAAASDDALAAALRRQHDLENLLTDARAEITSLRGRRTAAELSVDRLEQLTAGLERERADLLHQTTELRDQLRQSAAPPREPRAPRPNRATRRAADRKRHR